MTFNKNLQKKNSIIENVLDTPKPFLKWAGGKTQLLDEIHKKIPKKFNNYIEPFIGGGAVFFSLTPSTGVISDSNPQLINAYKTVRDEPLRLIECLKTYINEEEYYYKIRKLKYEKLNSIEAAARTIYLNRTCFNGLYRVNKKGEFNVPFGKYKNPNITQEGAILSASKVLQNVKIICADYKEVLAKNAKKGDLIFLDPPYLPISEYSDFQRYTKEQFYEEDHNDLFNEIMRLHKLGCHVILTNSNHPLVHDQYDKFEIEIINTKRNINSKGNSRKGQDLIVNIPPQKKLNIKSVPASLPNQCSKYPSTRYMGSKEKLLPYIADVASNFEYDSVLDLFSGSGVVSYMFKTLGKEVIANDYMAMSHYFTKAMVENNSVTLSKKELDDLFLYDPNESRFVRQTFNGLYFSDKENEVIDRVRFNIEKLASPYKRAIAICALIRACIKKRPRGIFTYTGLRYDDGRLDLRTSLEDHIYNAVEIINNAVFDNDKQSSSKNSDAMMIRKKADLVYIDPPYYSPHSDNEYVRRYHFVEGLARNWDGVDMQWHTKTKKFKNYPTPFSTRIGAEDAFDKLFKKLKNSIIIVSYSSNSLPTKDQLISIMSKHKKNVDVVSIDYKYSFGNQRKKLKKNQVKEYLFIGY